VFFGWKYHTSGFLGRETKVSQAKKTTFWGRGHNEPTIGLLHSEVYTIASNQTEKLCPKPTSKSH
jgi:hypothetical protein